MCGIFGWNHAIENNPDRVEAFYHALSHRGPDAKGINLSGDGILLGNTRLAINDLTDAGKQPIVDKKTKVSLVMNGEIYNFGELRRELIAHGSKFEGNSDTEVVLRGYLLWGKSVFAKLEGMFAVILSDPRDQSVIAARDRLGEKPLYFYQQNTQFAFCSEYLILAEQFLKVSERQLSLESRLEFLRYGYIKNAFPFGRSIRKVAPGSILSIANGYVLEEYYWQIRDEFKPKAEISKSRSYDRLDHIIKESVRLEIESSDVPVGVFLSGGTDSQLIALAASEVSKDIVFFTAAFNNYMFDESDQAASFAKKLGLKHVIQYVNYDMDEIVEIVKQLDLPLADTSVIPTYLISKYANKYVKVCLTGDGGDELFGGYTTYRATQMGTLFSKSHLLMAFLKWVAPKIKSDDSNIGLRYKIKTFARVAGRDVYRNHQNWRTIFSDIEIAELLFLKIENIPRESNEFIPEKNLSVLENCMVMDIENWLEGDILSKIDQTSMMNSLELRAPLLHPDVIDFALQLPLSMKIDFFRQKIILKKVLGKFTKKTNWLRKKGFGAPMNEWIFLHSMDFRKVLADNGRLNQNFIDTLFHRHLIRKEDNSFKIYALFVLTIWEKNLERNLK